MLTVLFSYERLHNYSAGHNLNLGPDPTVLGMDDAACESENSTVRLLFWLYVCFHGCSQSSEGHVHI